MSLQHEKKTRMEVTIAHLRFVPKGRKYDLCNNHDWYEEYNSYVEYCKGFQIKEDNSITFKYKWRKYIFLYSAGIGKRR